MKDLVEKVSSYNLFNYLFPGAIFSMLAGKITDYKLAPDDLLSALFAYYFIGLVISRIGSLVVEPILVRASFLPKSVYRDYVAASKKDPKLETLVEVSNMYRTVCAMFLSLMLIKLIEIIEASVGHGAVMYVGFMVLTALFALAYRKQSTYINDRVQANQSRGDGSETK
ncbi:hypothetical protein [Symbiobacterium terraclitae]|uniref:hypothetical protein n=1 Tax=Symbiobacterium terraclitae TaxID=557451 RepID=UPI0035B52C34